MPVSDRAISDVVGFAFMFAIIIFSVAVVSTAGVSQLSELRDSEQVNSAERGMQTLANTLSDLDRHADTFRTVSLAPGGGTIWLNDSEITVSVGGSFSETWQINSLEQRFERNPDDVSVAYEGGAVFRTDGATARSRPTWRCAPAEDVAIVTLVNVSAGANIDVGDAHGGGASDPNPIDPDLSSDVAIASGENSFRLGAGRNDTVVAYSTTQGSGNPLTVDVGNTANPDQWGFYLSNAGWSDVGSHTYECSGADTIVVRVVTVELVA